MPEFQNKLLTESEWMEKLVNVKLSFRDTAYRAGFDLLNQPEMRVKKTEIIFWENGDFQIIEMIETTPYHDHKDSKNNQSTNQTGTWNIVPLSPGKGLLKMNFYDGAPREVMLEIDTRGNYWLDGHRYCPEKTG